MCALYHELREIVLEELITARISAEIATDPMLDDGHRVRLISERTTAALQAKKASGAKLGNPTNLCVAGSIGRIAQAQVADEFATNLRPLVQAIQNAGALTLAEIASALNGRGVRPARGGKWHRSSVRNLLARIK